MSSTFTFDDSKVKDGETILISIALGTYIYGDIKNQFTILFEDGDHGRVLDKTPIVFTNDYVTVPSKLPNVEADENYKFYSWVRTGNNKEVLPGSRLYDTDCDGIVLKPTFKYVNPKGFLIGIREGANGTVSDKPTIVTDANGVIPNALPDTVPDSGYAFDK